MSQTFLLSLKNSYLVVPLVIFISIILSFIDSKISGEKKNRKDYLKLSLLVGSVASFIVYISNLKEINNEEVFTGPAPF